MNELKDPAKKKKKKTKESYNSFIRVLAPKIIIREQCFISVQQQQQQLQQQQQKSFGFINARFTILHRLSPRYRKKTSFEMRHIEAVREGQKYFTNSTSYRKI